MFVKKILIFWITLITLVLCISISEANAKYVIASSYQYSTDDFATLIEISELKGCQLKGNIFNISSNTIGILMECPHNFDYDKIFERYMEIMDNEHIKIEMPRDIRRFL